MITEKAILDRLIAREIFKRIDEDMDYPFMSETGDNIEFFFMLGKDMEASGKCHYFLTCRRDRGDYFTQESTTVSKVAVKISDLEIYDRDADVVVTIEDTSGIETLIMNMIR